MRHRLSPMRRRQAPRLFSRGVVILAVLVIVTLAALSAAVVVASAGTALIERRVEVDRTRLRLAAWSGLNATMQELGEQRDELLAGFAPVVTAERRFGTTPDGRVIVFRLVTTDDGSETEPDAAPALTPEAGGLDINIATADMLAALPGIDPVLADRIVSERPESGYASLVMLLAVEGVTPELLWGTVSGGGAPLEDVRSASSVPGGAQDATMPTTGLSRLLSVHAADPDVESGLSDPGTRGQRRLNLNTAWSTRLGRALDERFGAGTGSFIESMMANGVTFSSDAELLGNMARQIDSAEDWIEPFDALTTQPGLYRLGRVDINLAPASVLASIPGIDAQAAEQIVDRRERLDDTLRLTPLWPVVEGILTPEQMVEAIDWLGVRTMQWRVRIEVGYERPASDGLQMTGDRGGASPARVEHAMRFEAVLDVASTRPRLASCHEVSSLSWWRMLPAMAGAGEGTSEERDRAMAQANADTGFDALGDGEDADPASGAMSGSGRVAPMGSGAGIGSGSSAGALLDESMGMDRRPTMTTGRGGAGMARAPSAVERAAVDTDNRRGRWTGNADAGTTPADDVGGANP